MKKLLSILTLLVVAVTGAWADDPTLPANATPTGSLDILTGDAIVTAAFTGTNSGKKYLTYDMGTTIRTNVVKNKVANWATGPKNDGGGSQSAEFADGVTSAEKYGFKTSYSSYTAWGINKDRYCGIRVTNCVEAAVSTKSNGTKDGKNIQMQVYKKNGESWDFVETIGADKYNNSKAYVLTTSALDASEEYVILITSTNSSNSQAFEIRFAAPVAPTITAQPQGAEYITGYAAAAMHVTATASAGTLSYQWYRNTTATNTGGTLISGATGPSYAPSTDVAGTFYYYCVVTDANGSTASAVATIVVAAASAPTINVSGAPAEPVKIGTEVTLTAEVTGMPTPTVKWFSNTTASTTGGTVIEGATEETYSPSTATAGTYYYYAQAANTEGNALSAVQTIVVQEQVKKPTITPGSKHFTSSVTMTAASTTEGASYKYSIDGGTNWIDLPNEGVVFTETTNAQVKATKTDYVDSDVATATYTFYTPTPLATISEATTWDFANLSGGQQYSGDDLNTEFVYTDIEGVSVASGKTFNTGALAFTGEYPFRGNSNKYAQNGTLHFKTSVPGTIKVSFSDTGTSKSSSAVKRYLVVNDVTTEYWTSREKTGDGAYAAQLNVVTDEISVPAGDVTIKGTHAIIVTKVVFTPTEVPVTITEAGYASFASTYALDFTGTGVIAYIATGKKSESISMTEITKVPANTGIILKGAEGTVNVPMLAGDADDTTGNMLKAATGAETGNGAGNYYVLGKNSSNVVGFGPLANDVTLAKGKAYIDGADLAAKSFLPLDFGDEENETTSIKAVETAEVSGTVYNLAGQKVGKDYKGIVIVNGKKFVRK